MSSRPSEHSVAGTAAPVKQSGILKKKDGAGSNVPERASRVKEASGDRGIINVSIEASGMKKESLKSAKASSKK